MKTGPISELPSRRYLFIGGALSLAGLFIFVWLIRIQTSPTARQIMRNAQNYLYVRKTVYPERGNIYDRWGHLLAGNTEVYELGADLRYVKDPQNVAATLSTLLGLDYKTTYNALT